MTDRVFQDTLEQIARTGRCYSNEAKSMARELLERRAKESTEPDAQGSLNPIWNIQRP